MHIFGNIKIFWNKTLLLKAKISCFFSPENGLENLSNSLSCLGPTPAIVRCLCRQHFMRSFSCAKMLCEALMYLKFVWKREIGWKKAAGVGKIDN